MGRRDLWEIVRVVDVVPGDVVVADPSFHPATIDKKLDTGSIAIMGGIRMWCEPIFRRIDPADDPRVLRRALEIATRTHIEVFSETAFRTADDWVEFAREKMESEDQK